MKVALWLDDERPIRADFASATREPLDGIVWVRTAEEAIDLLKSGDVVVASLDHDLAAEHAHAWLRWQEAGSDLEAEPPRATFRVKTGLEVIAWMAESRIWSPTVFVHTANPLGRRDMMRMLKEKAPSHVLYSLGPCR